MASGRYHSRRVVHSPAVSRSVRSTPPGHGAVLDVVHRVGDVVGQVHHLRLQAATAIGERARVTHPGEHGAVVVVDTELERVGTLMPPPRVLRARVEGGAGQVQADRPFGAVERLGLESAEQAQCLRVALEATARRRELGQHLLAVVAERRVAEVVGEGSGLGDVGLAAERAREVARHLRHLEGVGEPVAAEVVGLRSHHLRLRRQPPRRGGVDHPRPVPLERRPLRSLDPFRWLRDHALAVVRVVAEVGVHRA